MRKLKKLSLIGVALMTSGLSHCVSTETFSPEKPITNPLTDSNRPNIVILIADDLGTDKVGVYQEGDNTTRPQTPNIDALASSGIRFDNAYAYPICSPTRASILTGRQAFRTGIGDAVAPRSDFTLQDSEVTLPELLKLANTGYKTAHFGKWHLGIQSQDPDNMPANSGFDYSAGFHSNLKDYYQFDKLVNGESVAVNQYATQDTKEDILSYIQSNQQAPFLVWGAFHAPHSPFHEPPSNMYQTPITDVSDRTQLYGASVEAFDQALGEIVKAVPENTLIFFIGDNGSPSAVTQAPLYRTKVKGTVYEGGVNIPMMVSGGALLEAQKGKTVTHLVHVLDIYATVADLLGVTPQSHLPSDHKLDSQSFADLLTTSTFSARETVSSEVFEPNGLSNYTLHQRMIRNQNFKLIQDVKQNTVSFFNMAEAPAGLDGINLCPCPANLSDNALRHYDALLTQANAQQN